jgi:hypothetical protein
MHWWDGLFDRGRLGAVRGRDQSDVATRDQSDVAMWFAAQRKFHERDALSLHAPALILTQEKYVVFSCIT